MHVTIHTSDGQPATGSPNTNARTISAMIAIKRNHGEHQPQIRGNLQRNIRKIDNPIKRITHKFPETPLGFSRRPFYILKFQPFGIISDPGKDSLGKAVVFADGKNGNLPLHGSSDGNPLPHLQSQCGKVSA